MCPENEDRAESFNGDQVIFVNTELIQRAVAGLQRSREEFQALLDQAELGDLSAQYDLAMKYADGDGVDRDMAQAAHWFAQARFWKASTTLSTLGGGLKHPRDTLQMGLICARSWENMESGP